MAERAEQICRLLGKFPHEPELGWKKPKYLVMIDFGHDGREKSAGRAKDAKRLSAAERSHMYSHICEFSKIAESHGIRAVVHHHSGGFLEFEDEIDDLLENIPSSAAGLCANTGHFTYAGMDAVYAIKKYAEQIEYVHFKDIDQNAYQRALEERLTFREAALQGVFRAIGDGGINYQAIKCALDSIYYEGYIVLEEDKDPRKTGTSLKDAKKSLCYVRALGFY